MNKQNNTVDNKTDGSLRIVRTLPGSNKRRVVHVDKGGITKVLVLEGTGRDKWRDQNKHVWTVNGNQLIASS